MNTFTDFAVNPINGQVSFTVNDVDIAINNAIRRVMLSEIPNVAVRFNAGDVEKACMESDIEFIENTTCLHNEFLGHRISLIPIHIDEKELENYDRDKYLFVINMHNQTHEMQYVTTNDITIFDENGSEYPPNIRQKIFPPSPITHDPIYIVALNPNHYNTSYGDKLHVRFRASIGIAHEHSRFSPVSACTYFNVIDREKADEAKRLLIEKTEEAMQKKDTGHKNLTPEEKKTLENRFEVHDAYRYFVKNKDTDEVAAVRFTIESECRLSVRYLFAKSIDVLVFKLQTLLRPNRYKITKHTHGETMQYSILIKNEQHTMGNLLQALMYNMYVREASDLAFVGYYLVHPLVQEIIMKLQFHSTDENYKNVEGVRAFFERSVKRIQTILIDLKNVWFEAYDVNMNSEKKEEKQGKQEKKGKTATKKKSSSETSKLPINEEDVSIPPPSPTLISTPVTTSASASTSKTKRVVKKTTKKDT